MTTVAVINALNMLSPYGMLAVDINTPGGHIQTDNHLYGTAVNLPGEMGGYVQAMLSPRVAYAENIDVLPTSDTKSVSVDSGNTQTISTMNSGGTQTVSSGGTGTVSTMNGGKQTVKSGGTGTVTTMSGGEQPIGGGTGKITTMNNGTQMVNDGGTGTVSTMSNGTQTLFRGGTGTVSTMSGGMQTINGGTGKITTMNNGTQTVDGGGTGTVTTMSGGEQNVSAGGTGTGTTMSGGTQTVGWMGTGTVETMNDGSQIVFSGGSGTVTTMNSGGTQTVSSGGSGTVTAMNSGSQVVQSGGSGSVANMSGGTQTIAANGSGSVANMSSGMQTICSGGTGTVGTMESGTQAVSAGGSGTISVLNGGTQTVSGTATVSTMSGGTQEVASGGTSKVESLQGGRVIENNGANISVTSATGGTWQINSGVSKTGGTISGYTMNVMSGATANSGTVTENGQIVVDGGKTSGTKIENGTETILSGGISENAEITSGGTQIVQDGGMASGTQIAGGSLTVNNGGMARETTLDSGNMDIQSGGRAIKTTVNGGELFVSAGGEATETIMQGGTISVDDNAYVQIDEATAGYLRLLYTGDAMAKFGNSAVNNHSYAVDRLFATGDKVVLGHGNDSGYSINNALTIGTMEGYADFIINTDLANNQSDKINIGTTTGTAGANGVIVNYDPSAVSAPGTTIESSSPTGTVFATTDSTAKFEGKASLIDIGGNTYEYMPEVTATPNGNRTDWAITRLRYGNSPTPKPKPSNLIKNALGNRSYMLGRWRDSNADILKRLNDVRRGGENGIWFAMTRGSQKAQDGIYNVNGTCTTLNLGFDRATKNGWTVGGAISHSTGSEGYEKGSGESNLTTLSAYAMWQSTGGKFAEFTARIGKLRSDICSTGNSGTIKANDIASFGQSLSAGYGIRMTRKNGWVFEPKAELTWAHLNSARYRTSEGTDTWANGANSVMASLGMHIGKFVGDKGYAYLDTKLVHDFAGSVGIDMYNRGWASLSDNISGTWLDTQLGYTCKAGAWDIFAEAGLRAGGSAITRNWQYRIGANFSF